MDTECWWRSFCARSIFNGPDKKLELPCVAEEAANYIKKMATASNITWWRLNVKFPISATKEAISGLIRREQEERGFEHCFVC